jgi:hypothetical protein
MIPQIEQQNAITAPVRFRGAFEEFKPGTIEAM